MDKLKRIIANILNIPEDQISEDLSIYNTDSWDSLSHMELIADIETEYSIHLSGEDIVEMIDVKSIIKIISKYK